MSNIGLSDKIDDLIKADEEAHEKNNSKLEVCVAYSFFNSFEKNMTISDGLTYCENVALEQEPNLPLWCFILACHLENRLTPELFERFMDIAVHDKTGKVARIERMRISEFADDDIIPETRRPRLWQSQE